MAGTIGELRSKLPKVESMHLLFERDRAKKDYGKVEYLFLFSQRFKNILYLIKKTVNI